MKITTNRPVVEIKRSLPPARQPLPAPPAKVAPQSRNGRSTAQVRAELPAREPLPLAINTQGGWALNGYEGQRHTMFASGILGGTQFFRCRCGLLLVECDTNLWWVPVTTAMLRLETLEQLRSVLMHQCWAHDRHRRGLRPAAEVPNGAKS